MDDSRTGNYNAIAALLDSLDVPIQTLRGHPQAAHIGESGCDGLAAICQYRHRECGVLASSLREKKLISGVVASNPISLALKSGQQGLPACYCGVRLILDVVQRMI